MEKEEEYSPLSTSLIRITTLNLFITEFRYFSRRSATAKQRQNNGAIDSCNDQEKNSVTHSKRGY